MGSIIVEVAPGWANGTVVTFKGMGHQLNAGIEKGDVKLTVITKPHAHFVRRGVDLVYTHKLGLSQALVGHTLEVTLLNGHTIAVPVPDHHIEGREADCWTWDAEGLEGSGLRRLDHRLRHWFPERVVGGAEGGHSPDHRCLAARDRLCGWANSRLSASPCGVDSGAKYGLVRAVHFVRLPTFLFCPRRGSAECKRPPWEGHFQFEASCLSFFPDLRWNFVSQK